MRNNSKVLKNSGSQNCLWSFENSIENTGSLQVEDSRGRYVYNGDLSAELIFFRKWFINQRKRYRVPWKHAKMKKNGCLDYCEILSVRCKNVISFQIFSMKNVIYAQ